jgi:hypothetical protein
MNKPMQTFLVTFTETTGYRLKVQAADRDTAIEQALGLFERVGPEPSVGFDFDSAIEGGTDDWEARLLDPITTQSRPIESGVDVELVEAVGVPHDTYVV